LAKFRNLRRLWLAKIQKPIKMPENPTHCLVCVHLIEQKLDCIPLKIGIIPIEIAVILEIKQTHTKLKLS